MEYRTITLEELRASNFAGRDVIQDEKAQKQREHDLKSAMAYTNIEHDDVGLIIELESGERVQYFSDMIELEGGLVELKGGYAIPVKAVFRIDI